MGDIVSLPNRIEIQPENIPEELKSLDQWLLWEWVRRGDKLTKPPYQTNGKLAKSTDPRTWSTFEKVLETLAHSKYSGIGFALTLEDTIVAWDLDHCINVKTGQLEAWAEEIVQSLNSYTEITPSGEGLRILVKGNIPQDGRKKGPIECYKTGRYVTITGNHYPNTPLEIKTVTDETWRSVFEGNKDPIRKLKQNKQMNLLILGQWEEAGYASQSEADLAFCRYLAEETDGNAEQMDKLFRESKLYRPKWDKPHYGDGTTYGQGTIKQALAGYDTRFRLTDLGNARRFARQISEEVRFCHNRWFIWDGKRLAEDRTQHIYILSHKVVKELFDEAHKIEDDERQKKMQAHAFQLESRSKLESMVKLTEHQPKIAIVPEELDKNPYFFNCENGIITDTGDLLKHNFGEMITKLSPIIYNPEAKAPLWEEWLKEILVDDELISYIARAVGYSMTGLITEQKLFFAYGTGQNGKSTFFHVLSKVFGDYFSSMPVESLMATRNDQHPTILADLRGVRFVLAAEPEEGRRFNEGLLKQITGGEKIVARRMREDFQRFESSSKLWIMGNHKPTIRGTDYAIWRRIHIIPFTVTIPKESQDKGLWPKLEQELEGILAWCVRGYMSWLKEGLNAPKSVETATEDYRVEMDVVQDFLDECTVITQGQWILHSDLYARYAGVTRDKNERILSSKVLAQKLREKGFNSERRTGNQVYWANIVLREAPRRKEDEM